MRKSYSNQLRLDSVPIEKVSFNLESRESLVPCSARFSLFTATKIYWLKSLG